MSFGPAARIGIAAALLGATGCDFWTNLVGEKALTRGKLEIEVVDAWTGAALRPDSCGDDLGVLEIGSLGEAAYGQEKAPTGHYSIRCKLKWYHEGAAEANITASGARIVIKLARQVGPDNWYPDPAQNVHIPGPGGLIRFPRNLDWPATPADDSGHFLYEWTFAVNDQFDRGPWQPQRQPPKEAYSPHFRARVSKENNIKPGPDKVTLKVYSLLHDPKRPELVGTDSLDIEWVANKLPLVRFERTVFTTDTTTGKPLPRYQVDCLQAKKKQILLDISDPDGPDGKCDSVHLWGISPRSEKYFSMDLSCDSPRPTPIIPLFDPKALPPQEFEDLPSSTGPNGAKEFDNTLIAEVVDENGERNRDTVHFRTHLNVPPFANLRFDTTDPDKALKHNYLVGDSVRFVVQAHDTDGSFEAIFVPWLSAKTNLAQDTGNYMVNIPSKNDVEFSGHVHFHYPESTLFYATVSDNCGDLFETTPRNIVNVVASRPPAFTRVKPTVTPKGDTVIVGLELEVNDPDGIYRDRIGSIRIKWGDPNLEDGGIDSLAPDRDRYVGEHRHKYVHPAANTPISIQIRARDVHDSVSETSYTFTPPESPPPSAAPPLR